MPFEWSWNVDVGDVLVFLGLVVTAGTVWQDRRFRTLEFAASQFNDPSLVDIRGWLDEWHRSGTSPAEVDRKLRKNADHARHAHRFLQAGDRVAIGCRGLFLSGRLVLRGWRREWLQQRYEILSEFIRGRTIERGGTDWPYPYYRKMCGWKTKASLDGPHNRVGRIRAVANWLRLRLPHMDSGNS